MPAILDDDAWSTWLGEDGATPEAAKALLNENPKPTRDQVRAGLTGNLCRCSNYNHYVEAVMAAAGTLSNGGAA